jgi:prephenate dehydratase
MFSNEAVEMPVIQQKNKTLDGIWRVAIQGIKGAFHDVAAHHFHVGEKIELVDSETFDELIKNVETGKADAAVMAIENTIAGSLLRNYNLLEGSHLKIHGEIFLRIKQNLMALPGVKISDLREVHSHPIALQQCVEFFKQYPKIRLVETSDTALEAKKIRKNHTRTIGAVAAVRAAEIYGLNLLAESIETFKQNYTRFLYLSTHEMSLNMDDAAQPHKVSLVFTAAHSVGSLHHVLAILAIHQCNLTKIQSAPIMDKPWEYMFFADFTMEDVSRFEEIIEKLRTVTGTLKVFGLYKSGKYFE